MDKLPLHKTISFSAIYASLGDPRAFLSVITGATLETMKRKIVNARRNISVIKPPSPAKVIINNATRTSIPPITAVLHNYYSIVYLSLNSLFGLT
jgi:hypothetical protein